MDHKDFKGHLRSSAPAVICSHVEVMLPESRGHVKCERNESGRMCQASLQLGTSLVSEDSTANAFGEMVV